MTDRFDYEVSLNYSSMGPAEQLAELGRLAGAIDKAVQSGEKLSESHEELAKSSRFVAGAIQPVIDTLDKASSDSVPRASSAWNDHIAVLDSAANAYKRAREEQERARSSLNDFSDLPENPALWSDRELSDYQKGREADNATLDKAVADEQRRRADATREFADATELATQAQERLNSAMAAAKPAAQDDRSRQEQLQAEIKSLISERDNAQREVKAAQEGISQGDSAAAQEALAAATTRKAIAQERLNELRQEKRELEELNQAEMAAMQASVQAAEERAAAEAQDEDHAARLQAWNAENEAKERSLAIDREITALDSTSRYERETEGLNSAEKAAYDNAQAVEALADAQRELNALEEGTPEHDDARLRLEQAKLEQQRTGQALSREIAAEEQVFAEQRAAAALKQEEAYQKQNEALGNLDFDKSITGMDKMEAATTKLARAQDELDAALEQVREEERQGGGAGTATAEAYDQVTAAAKRRSGAEKELTGVLQSQQAAELNLRYGLYDVSRTMALVSGAIVGVGAASVSAFAEWESGMSLMYQTNMDKPTSEVDRLGRVVRDLAGDIPIAVSELQGLIALAGQLDVQGDLGGFAEVMAQFGMISDTVDAEEAATRIAKLVNVLGGAEAVASGMGLSDVEDAYRAIATSIAEVGVNSAATDAEILHTASNMARVAAQANFTGDEVVGLASAFASMGMPAELSRSAFQDFVKVVNLGLAGVGEMPEKLDRMAQLMGITSEEIAGLWEADPAEFFLQLLAAVDAAADAGENVTGMLYEMGITSQRGAPAIAALAGNYDLVADSLGSAHKGMKEFDDENSTFAQRMEHIADDLASMWQILKNEFAETAAIVGEVIAPALKDLIVFIGGALEGIQEFIRTPFGAWLLDVGLKIAGLVAGIAAILSVAAAAGASMIAFKWSMKSLPIMSTIGRLFGLRTATKGAGDEALATGGKFRAMGLGARIGAAGVTALGHALKAARLVGFMIALDFLIRLIFDFNRTVFDILKVMASVSTGISNFVISASRSLSSLVAVASRAAEGMATALVTGVNAAIDAINGLHAAVGSPLRIPKINTGAVTAGIRRITAGVHGALADVSRMAQNNMDIWAQVLRDWREFSWGESSKSGVFPGGTDAEWAQWFEDLEKYLETATEDGIGNGAAKGADRAKKELRLLTDYASDLAGVMARAFDLRFGATLTGDDITSAFMDMADAAEEAQKNVRDIKQALRELRADMQSTAASISQHEYWLSVAIEYGDDLRAEELEAELAKLRAEQAKQADELADKTKDLADAEDEASMSLEGNTRAAVEQRKTMTDLISTYMAHLEMLAATGMSQEDLAKEAARMKEEFMEQAVGLGYSRDELEKYAAAFDDMGLIIERVPRDVDIEFDGDPALTALREFFARLEDDMGGGLDVPVTASGLADLEDAFYDAFDSIGAAMGGFPSLGESVFGDRSGIRSAGAVAASLISTEVNRIGASLGKGLKSSGKKAGAALNAEMKKAGSDLSTEMQSAGQKAGAGLNTEMGKAGQKSGTSLRDAFQEIVDRLVDHLKSTGQKAGAGLDTEMTKAGRKSGEGLERNVRMGLDSLTMAVPGLALAAGLAYRTSFEGTSSATGIGFGNKVVTGVTTARTKVLSQGTLAGNAYRSALETAGTSTLGSRMGDLASSALSKAQPRVQASGINAGNAYRGALETASTSTLASRMGNLTSAALNLVRPRVQASGTNSGNAYRSALETASTSTLGSRMGNLASSALNKARSQIQSSGRSAGNSWNSGIRSSMNSGLTSSATTAGRNAANGFIAGMKAGLRGKSLGSILASGLGGKAGSQNVGKLYMANWWTGGYTGPGGKYTPAGIVHKGEYVVPKHGVDQRSGLPKADYMNSLGKPHQGSKASYASGGYVRGGNSGTLGGGLTDADRRLIRSVANRPVRVEISSDAVARANNRANSRGSARGV